MTAWTALRTAPPPCPACGAPWKLTEITGAARHGGGYRLLCHGCEHRWDDPDASHGERREARRSPAPPHLPPTTWHDITKGPRVKCAYEPCTRKMRKALAVSDPDGRQWCTQVHKDLHLGTMTTTTPSLHLY